MVVSNFYNLLTQCLLYTIQNQKTPDYLNTIIQSIHMPICPH